MTYLRRKSNRWHENITQISTNQNKAHSNNTYSIEEAVDNAKELLKEGIDLDYITIGHYDNRTSPYIFKQITTLKDHINKDVDFYSIPHPCAD